MQIIVSNASTPVANFPAAETICGTFSPHIYPANASGYIPISRSAPPASSGSTILSFFFMSYPIFTVIFVNLPRNLWSISCFMSSHEGLYLDHRASPQNTFFSRARSRTSFAVALLYENAFSTRHGLPPFIQSLACSAW